jgi:hypothetical protein
MTTDDDWMAVSQPSQIFSRGRGKEKRRRERERSAEEKEEEVEPSKPTQLPFTS